jgi:hypothetical protein
MGQGAFVLCEWESAKKEFPEFQKAFAELDARVVTKCLGDWDPKKFGYLTPTSEEFGRTTILPALFQDHTGLGVPLVHWRQRFTTAGHQLLIAGSGTGYILPEGFKVAWIGLMFPNKQQHITELRWQIGDSKYGRINIEEIKSYNKPALIFEEGFLINEEQSFDLYGYVEGPIAVDHEGRTGIDQRIVMLGAAYYKQIDKVLGAPGAAL